MTQNTPHIHPDIKKWKLSRRSFLKTTVAASLASTIPLWVACESKTTGFTLNQTKKQIVAIVQEFLFPKDGNGPSASDIKAIEYFQWMLWETGTDNEDKEYLLKGINWVEETSVEETERSFLNLRSQEQSDLIDYISTTSWGESWLSMMITIIFEALFCDPVYGVNIDQSGWKWLEHNPGQPRPSEQLKLGNFMNHVKKNLK